MAPPNDACGVIFRTLRFDRAMNAAECDRVQNAARERGVTIVLRSNEPLGRTYGLVESDEEGAHAIGDAVSATVYQTAIIALAVFPAIPEALPLLIGALGGPGRPSGLLECVRCGQGAIIEWDPQRSSTEVVMGLVDVELQRLRSGRTAQLLSPLPESIVAQICADGLQCAEVTPEGILETLLERAGLGDA